MRTGGEGETSSVKSRWDGQVTEYPKAFEVLVGGDGFHASGGHAGSLETEKQVASPFHGSEHFRVRRCQELGQGEA